MHCCHAASALSFESAWLTFLVVEDWNHRGKAMNLRNTFRQWTTYLHTVEELNRCSDRDLADLGIRRADIRAVARKSARAAVR
jgi:uncharacterized protein YjiS (DUF1127 family)